MTSEKNYKSTYPYDVFDEEIVDIEWINKTFSTFEKSQLQKRLFSQDKKSLLRPTLIFIFVLSLIFLSLHVLITKELTTFAFYPIHLFIASVYGLIILLFIKGYNGIQLRISKRKSNKDRLKTNQELAIENNRNIESIEEKHVTKSISIAEKSKEHYIDQTSPKINLAPNTNIPFHYKRKEVLEILLQYIKDGRAFSEDEAVKLFEQEHPNFLAENKQIIL